MNLTLPECATTYYPDKLIPLTLYSLQFNTYNDEFRRLKGGPMLKKITNDMLAKREGTLQPEPRKMFLYIGHDSTVVDLLNTMYIWHYQLPYYNIMTMIELHEDDGEWNVQVSDYYGFLNFPTSPVSMDNFPSFWTFHKKLEELLKILRILREFYVDTECAEF